MGKYVSWDEQCKRREAVQAQHKETRGKNRDKNEAISKALHKSLRSYVYYCGLSRVQISDFSGLVPSKVTEFLRGYKGGLRFSSFVAMANVAGYRVKLEKLPPEADEYRSFRRFAPPSVEKTASNT